MSTSIANFNVTETPEQIKIRQKLNDVVMQSSINGETAKLPLGETIFKMKFKKGPVSQEVFFQYANDQRKAETIAREYCGRFRLRFIWVEPFFIDINSQPQEEKEQLE